jgi:hypothetical protein
VFDLLRLDSSIRSWWRVSWIIPREKSIEYDKTELWIISKGSLWWLELLCLFISWKLHH